MAKWAEKPWVDTDTTEIEALLIRIRRVANMIKTDAVCKSRPTVRDKASEIEALITLLEKRLINKETLR
tara:strand:+ start:152 stop:358 length:207 start_codon:yes stop_codon:yes gene_type:complete